MITLMVGRAIDQLYPPRTLRRRRRVLLADARPQRDGVVKDINLALHARRGARPLRPDGLRAAPSSRASSSVSIRFDSGEIRHRRPAGRRRLAARAASRSGIAFVTENRREEGLLMNVRDRRQHRARRAAEVRG